MTFLADRPIVWIQAGFAAQKAFLVGIQNGDQRHFRQVEAFTEQIHADHRVEFLLAQFAQDFDSFNRIEFRMQPLAAHAFFLEVIRQIFGPAVWSAW